MAETAKKKDRRYGFLFHKNQEGILSGAMLDKETGTFYLADRIPEKLVKYAVLVKHGIGEEEKTQAVIKFFKSKRDTLEGIP